MLVEPEHLPTDEIGLLEVYSQGDDLGTIPLGLVKA